MYSIVSLLGYASRAICAVVLAGCCAQAPSSVEALAHVVLGVGCRMLVWVLFVAVAAVWVGCGWRGVSLGCC